MPYDLKDALKILESGRPIASLTVIKLDTKKKTGGEVLTYRNCRIARRQPQNKQQQPSTGKTEKARNARHGFNFTRNIQLANGGIRTIHPLFIESINGVPLI